MSGVEKRERRARLTAFGIVAAQLGITLWVALAVWAFAGLRAGYSVLAGGGIGTAAGLWMAVALFRPAAGADPKRVLVRFYLAELYKLAITAGLFALALVYTDVSFGPMLGGLGATLIAYWLALGIRLAD